MTALLDAVTKAKTAHTIARTTLEARLREQLRNELANTQTQIDLAVRYAYNGGESKADILRALGTKDYHTLNASLERTSAVAEIIGDDPLDSIFERYTDGEYGEGDELIRVTYNNEGPNSYTGTAVFSITKLGGGQYLPAAITPLWNADYTVRNDVVAALDGVTSGYYYDQFKQWLDAKW